MKYYRVRYASGDFDILQAKDDLTLIKKYDLASKKHINTTIRELSGEQEAIARSNGDLIATITE